MSASSFAAVRRRTMWLLMVIAVAVALPASAHVPAPQLVERIVVPAPEIEPLSLPFEPVKLYDGPTSFSIFTISETQASRPLCVSSDDRAQQHLMHARYYSSGTGRFLSVDPALDLKKVVPNPQAWNRYSYVLNNPMNRVDPDGKADVGLDCVPASVCTPQMQAAVRNAQGQALKAGAVVAAGALVVRFAPAVASALFSWALGNPNQATQVASAVLSPPGSSALPVTPISGEVLREFSTSKGAVGILANASSEGTVLTLKDAAVYPMTSGSLTNQVGPRQMLEALKQLGVEAKAAGYTQMVVQGTRVSGANPGKLAQVTLDLTKLEP